MESADERDIVAAARGMGGATDATRGARDECRQAVATAVRRPAALSTDFMYLYYPCTNLQCKNRLPCVSPSPGTRGGLTGVPVKHIRPQLPLLPEHLAYFLVHVLQHGLVSFYLGIEGLQRFRLPIQLLAHQIALL